MPWWGKNHWKVAQVAAPLLPIPLGCWFLYKAILSFNRSPPPIATTAEEASHKLYPEPVYQSFSFRPSTFAENASSREAIHAARRERRRAGGLLSDVAHVQIFACLSAHASSGERAGAHAVSPTAAPARAQMHACSAILRAHRR